MSRVKEEWDKKVPTFRNKAQRMLDSGNQSKSVTINPFLDRSGKLINPYRNYQKALDDPNVSARAKAFISQATGLSPTKTTAPANVSGGETVPAALSAPSAPVVQATQQGAPVTPTESDIVSAAKGYIGTPYVWGGESMDEGGMDCSGFVYNALRDAGYDIGRTTAQGYRGYGTKVDPSQMQAGDLVFFGNGDKATHIGIYMGDGKIIHSSGGGPQSTKNNPGKGVQISNINYRNDFIEARRY